MTPKVTYKVAKGIVKIRIKIHTLPAGTFDTGISCPADKFDAKKQICGLPKVQTYMQSTAKAIENLFLPGNTPASLWIEFNKQSEASNQAHTVKDACDYYLNNADVTASTMTSKITLINMLKKLGYYDKPIQEMNGATFRAFLTKLDLGESSTHAAYVKLKTILGLYIKDQSLSIKLPKGLIKATKKIESDETEYLTWEELQKVLNAEIEDKNLAYGRDMFCLMAFTGMAIGDLLVFRPEKAISGDGKFLSYARNKTKSKCVLPYLPQAKAIVDRYKWPIKKSKRTLQYHCENIVSELAGRPIKSHGGRKTAGTLFLTMGFSIESVAKFLGHSNPMITAQIYAKVVNEKIELEMLELPESAKKMMGI